MHPPRLSVGGFGLERDGKLGVHSDAPTGGGVSRLEVIEGPTGRRRRTQAERARIVAALPVFAELVVEAPRGEGAGGDGCHVRGGDRRRRCRDPGFGQRG